MKNVGGVGFLVNDTWAKWGFEIWPLWWVLRGGNIMASLGLIDFKLGLYIKVNINVGQNKFEVHISKHFGQNGHQLAQNRRDATFGQEH